MRLRRLAALSAVTLGCLVACLLPAQRARGSFDHAIAALAVNGLVAAGVGAILCAVLLVRRRRRRQGLHPGLERSLGLCGLLLALQLALGASFPLGRWLHARDVADARNWCEAQLPYLERIRRESGEYPEQLPPELDRPRLFRSGDAAYRRLEHGFEFVVLPRSRTGRDGVAYLSSDGRWHPRAEVRDSLESPADVR